MNILYVAPRYHTNQVPIMKGWHDHNCRVMFMAEFEGISEVHDYVEFYRLKESWITKVIFALIDKKYGPNQAEGKKINLFIPAFWNTLRTIREFQPDLVIVRERYITNFVIYLICRILHIRNCILYVQQPIYGNEINANSIKKFLKKCLFPKAVFSPVFYHGKKRGITKDSEISFVPLVADNKGQEGTLFHEYFSDDTIRFLDIGKYREYKNHFFLVDVFNNIKDKINGINIKLTIIGQLSNSDEKQYYDRLKAYIHEKQLEDLIEVRKNIPFSQMDNLYDMYDVLLLPSTYESAGMVILEAMERGLCVAASIYCGLASYLEEYQCGYTFDIEDTEELENLIIGLIKNRERIVQAGKKGVEVIQKKLSFDNYLGELNLLTEKEFGYTLIDKLG